MPDRDEVMQWLETCVSGCEEGCPYEYKNLVYRVECKADLMRDALALLKEQETGGWISVKDRLPPNAEHLGSFCPRYLVKTEFGVTEGWYNPDRGNWFVLLWSMLGRFDLRDIDIERGDRPGVSARVAVTHWMPMPEPPEEENAND